MGLVVQLMCLVLQGFAVLLTLQESAGSSIAPSPSQITFGSFAPTTEGALHPIPHGMQSRINAASPASQPNVRPLNLAPAPVSTKVFIPLLSPSNPVLPPNMSAAPSGDVPSIVPSLSPSTSRRKAPNKGGRKLAPENLVLIVTPLPKSLQNPPMTQPVIHNYAPSISPQIKKPNIPSASPPSNLPSYSPPLTPSMPEVSPSILPGPDISSMSTPLPSFDQKGNGKPIVAPSNGTPKQVSPLDSPTKAPMKSYSRDPASAPLSVLKSPLHAARLHSPTPSPSISVVRHFSTKKSFTSPVPSSDLVHSTASKLLPHGHSPVKAPMQDSYSDSVKAPSHSLIKSPPHKWVQRISPIPQTPYNKRRRTENNSSSSNPSFVVPPASTNEDIAAPPSYPPKVNPHSRHKSRAPPIQNAVASANSPSASAPVSPTRVSQEMTIPHFPTPNSPSGASSPKNPKVPHLPHIQALPPPPPNEDCEPLSCREPYTNNPSGSPCGCVLAMQVGLRLNLPLYTFFPLVSDLAAEVSRGLVMKQSQVRIMGANADETQEKTIVFLDLVPSEAKFDNSTAYLIYQKLSHKQLAIEPYYFGNYEVLYLHYPGLPASPYTPSTFAGQAYSDQGDKGRPLKPLGVDVRKQKHKKGLKGSLIAIIILLAFLSLTLCCGVAWVVFFRQRSKAQLELSPITIVPSLAKSSGFGASKIGSGLSSFSPSYTSGLTPYTGTAKTFSASEIERATDSFNASRILGEGGFGIVYSGVLVDGTEVAVKVLKKDNQQGGREFLSEVEMLSRLHHRNLVKLLGICMAEHARCLVYELIANGSVESHLHGVDKDNAPLDWNARLKVALGAARGLAYLHEDSSPRVIHRDFKSSNILLEHDFTPKVSDFGLARIASDVENQHISTRVMGTFGYVAPEYAMTGHLLIKSDVYSYGVVLLELLTGRKPVDMSRPSGQENLVTWARPLLTSKEGLELMIDQSLMPDCFFESIAKVAAIASMCVQPEVSDRPFMSEVVQALKLIYNQCCATNNSGSKICSPEHISFHSSSTNSGRMPYHIQMQSPVSDVEWGLRASEVFSASARFASTNKKSFWRHSSPGPLRSRRVLPFFPSMRRWSGDSTSEHGASLRLWSRSR